MIRNKLFGFAFLVTGFLVCAWIVVVPIRQARAGSCFGGDRAKIRYLFEHIEHLAASGIQKAGLQARSVGWRLARYLPHFSLWWLQVQRRHALLDLLQSAEKGSGTDLDIVQLRTEMASFFDRAARIHEHFGGQKPDVGPLLDELIVSVVHTWAVCRSIESAGVEPCRLLKTIDPGEEQNCISLMLRFGILYSGRCSLEKHGELLAKLLGEPPEKAKTTCEILKNQQGERCQSAMSSPLKIQICLALTGGGETACKQASLPEKLQNECLRNLYDYQVAIGSRSLISWEQLVNPHLMLYAAVLSTRERGECVEVTMRMFDSLDKSAEILFPSPGKWYQPPGLPP